MIQIICILNTWLNGYEDSGDERACSSGCYVNHSPRGWGGWKHSVPAVVSHLVLQLPLHAFPDCNGNQTEDTASGSTQCPSEEWLSCSKQAQSGFLRKQRQACCSLLASIPPVVIVSRFFNPWSLLDIIALWVFWFFPPSSDYLPMKDFQGDKKLLRTLFLYSPYFYLLR